MITRFNVFYPRHRIRECTVTCWMIFDKLVFALGVFKFTNKYLSLYVSDIKE